MAKVPPQFQKKTTVDTRGKGKVQPNGNKPPFTKKGPSIAPQNRTPVDAPNAGQDEALAVVRDSLTAPKKTPTKGVSKGKPMC